MHSSPAGTGYFNGLKSLGKLQSRRMSTKCLLIIFQLGSLLRVCSGRQSWHDIIINPQQSRPPSIFLKSYMPLNVEDQCEGCLKHPYQPYHTAAVRIVGPERCDRCLAGDQTLQRCKSCHIVRYCVRPALVMSRRRLTGRHLHLV